MGKVCEFSNKCFLILFTFLMINLALLFVILSRMNASENYPQEDFSLLSPYVAQLNVEEFIEVQKSLTVSYWDLKAQIAGIVGQANGTYSVYVEDLITGAWVGINEKEKFYPASLVKVPYMIALLKKVERGELSLNTTVALTEEDLDARFGTMYLLGEGYNATVYDLMVRMIKESDNTAYNALRRQVTIMEVSSVVYTLGLYQVNETEEETRMISAKSYSNLFRSFYFSTYLRRPLSQLALSVMEDTVFDSHVKSGLPPNIEYSHKIGIQDISGYYHDCGIVYLPKKPYLICIMSSNTTWDESREVMSKISSLVYNHMEGTLADSRLQD